MMSTPTFVTAVSTPATPHTMSRAAATPAAHLRQHVADPRVAEQRSNADVLLWQNRLRVALALAVAIVASAIHGGMFARSPRPILEATGLYLAVLALVSAGVHRGGRAGNLVLAVTTVADLALIFALVAIVAPTHQLASALLASFLVLQFTVFYFGRAAGSIAVAGIAVGYVLLVRHAIAGGAGLAWRDELSMLAISVFVALVFMALHGANNQRLSRLVTLFARAQRGDFTRSYETERDERPDGITLVGRSYNQFRAQLADLVLSDPLTGCLNRRGLTQQLHQTVARLERSRGALTLIAIDVDHFKAINDRFGHLVGDEVLREIGELLRGRMRAGDVIARTGGEEFVVILPEVSAEHGRLLGEALCRTFRQHAFAALAGAGPVTVSLGVATDRIVDPGVAQAMLARADEALYAAKRGGRDQVVVWADATRAAREPVPATAPALRIIPADVSMRRRGASDRENRESGGRAGGPGGSVSRPSPESPSRRG